ncbi:hypothetical protein Pint_24166 [Pistacia integerrima]|uniref:Uncharacterized protein n=1 Tax=Pistacia integerrima TaxID=434235 RepID=A0ACC0YC51_9ROSI|nr:hypothetical protein Pint_24166 [Pistacia integerrima]
MNMANNSTLDGDINMEQAPNSSTTLDGDINTEQAPESLATLDGDSNTDEQAKSPGSSLDGVMKIEQAPESPGTLDGGRELSRNSPVVETEKIPEENGNAQVSDGKKEKEQGKSVVPYYKLFSFADSFDYFLIFWGTIAAIGNGLCMPLMSLLLGELIDAAGKPTSTTVMVHGVFKVSLKFVYLALGACAASFLQVSSWTVTGERQAARIRSLYLKTILRQEIGFFDKETSTGEIVGRMSGDTILIQDAMGEKVGQFIQNIFSFFGGFVLAFARGWLLTLVMLCSIPPIAISGGLMMKLIGTLASHEQTAYSQAATIVDQTIGSIRTVASYTGEQLAISKYNKSLIKAYKSSVQQGLATGLGMGIVMFISYCGYGLAVWFGGRMIIDKGYTGGDVLIVIFGVLLGSASLGQASPSLSAFAAGQAAAFKMFEAINRRPDIDAYDTNGRKLDEIRGSHFELLKDHDGAYSQLIRLQEIGKESQKDASIQSDSGRHSWVQYVASPISRISDRSPEMSPEKSPEKSIDSTPASEKPQISQQVSLSRLARLNSPEIPMLLLGSIFAAANGVILPIFGMVLASVIKTFYEPEEKLKRDSSFWALIFVAIGVACFLSFPMSSYFFGVAGCKLIKRIRSMCFEKVVHMEIGWFDEAEHSSGAIGARLSSDATSVRSSVGDTLALLVQNAATAAAGLIIGFKTNWELSLIILAFFPLLGLSAYGQMKAIYFSSVSGNDKKMYEEASQVVSDAVGSIRTVASFCTEEKVIELYQKKCDGPVKAKIKQGLIRGLCYGLSFFFFFFIYAVEFFIGGILVNHGRTTFNDFFHVSISFFMSNKYFNMTAFGISRTTSLAPDVAKAKTSSASVFGLLDQISKIDSSDNTGTTLDNVRGEVEFRHVSFKYPTRPDTEIFHDLCLTIHSGKVMFYVS